MGTKSSTGQKAQYSAYAGDNRAIKNAARKLARHIKAHPGDAQAANTSYVPENKGKFVDHKSQFATRLDRAVNHDTLFGSTKNRVVGRDLSTPSARAKFTASAKKAPSITKKAA